MSKLDEMIKAAEKIMKGTYAEGIFAFLGHVGDGNFHIFIPVNGYYYLFNLKIFNFRRNIFGAQRNQSQGRLGGSRTRRNLHWGARSWPRQAAADGAREGRGSNKSDENDQEIHRREKLNESWKSNSILICSLSKLLVYQNGPKFS